MLIIPFPSARASAAALGSLPVVVQSLSCVKLVGFLCPWDFSGKNTGVGCHFLLQGIFLVQGLNPRFPHSRWILYH